MVKGVYRVGAGSLAAFILAGLAVSGTAAETPATVATIQGDLFTGRFVGAGDGELSVQVGSRTLKIPLRDVRYISFVGPLGTQPTAHAKPETPASRLRADALADERAGRLEEALRKFLEAAKLDDERQLSTTAAERIRQKLAAQASAVKAAPYKKLALALNDAGRYREASACYDDALRFDPNDSQFREQLAPTRHYWQPTVCPISTNPAPPK